MNSMISENKIDSAVRDLNEHLYNLWGSYGLTGDRQNILTGMFKWLLENKHDPMSVGEIRSAMRKACPELLDYKF
jgi:hypothetical protein